MEEEKHTRSTQLRTLFSTLSPNTSHQLDRHPIDVLVFKMQTPPRNLGLIHFRAGINKMTSFENGSSDVKLEKGGHCGGPWQHDNRGYAGGVRL